MRQEIDYYKTIQLHFSGESSELAISVLIYNDLPDYECFYPFLHNEEKSIIDKLKLPKPKAIFALGRYCAKKAISHFNESINYSEINIARGVSGFPIVVCTGLRNICVSIAHTDKAAVAVAFSENLQIGIDIEPLAEKNNDIIASQLLHKEKNFPQLLGLPQLNCYHLLWTAKEALGKAIKTGFTIPMNFFEVSNIYLNESYSVVEFKNFPQFKALSFYVENYMITFALPKIAEIFE